MYKRQVYSRAKKVNSKEASQKYKQMLDEIVNMFGCNGALTEEVLKHFCPIYRTRYKRIRSRADISKAIVGNPLPRVVVMRFSMRNGKPDCWEALNSFAEKGVEITSQNLGLIIKQNKVCWHMCVYLYIGRPMHCMYSPGGALFAYL